MRQLKISTSITNRDSQAVEKYLQEIGKIDLITPEEEARLARQRNENEPGSREYQDAIDRLVKANLRFGVSVAKQFQHQGLSLSDLVSEANYGLIKAAQRFDETKGFKFISYAVWWVRQTILQALSEQGRIVRLPQNKIGTVNKVYRAMQEFEQTYERLPSDEELSEILDMNVEEVEEILMLDKRHSSMDAPIGSDDGSDSLTLLDTIKSTQEELFIGFETKREENGAVHRAIEIVFPIEDIDAITDSTKKKNAHNRLRAKEIIYAHYGMYGYTIEYIEQKYSLTKERIRQIKEKTIRGLKANKNFMHVLRGEETKVVRTVRNTGNNNKNSTDQTIKGKKGKNAVPKIYEEIPTHNIHNKGFSPLTEKKNSNSPSDTQLVGKILRYILVNENRHDDIATILNKNTEFIPLVQEICNSYKLGNKYNLGLVDIIKNAKTLQGNYKNGVNSIKQAISRVVG